MKLWTGKASVVLAYISLLMLGFFDNLRGPYFPSFLKDLELTDIQGSWFFALTSVVAFFTSWWTRSFVARFSSEMCLMAAMLINAVAAAILSLASGFSMFLTGAFLFGVGFGMTSVAQNTAIANNVQGARRAQILSGLHSVYGLASLLSPITVIALAELQKSWSSAFGILSAVQLGLFLYFFVIWSSKSHPRLYTHSDLENLECIDNSSHKMGWIMWFAIAVSIYLFSEISLSSRMVLFLVRHLEMSLEQASFYLTMFFAGLFFSRASLFFLQVHHCVLRFIYGSLALSLICFVFGLYYHPLFLSLCGFTLGPFVPLSLEYLIQVFDHEKERALSVTMAFFSLIVVVLHLMLGWLTENFGIQKALLLGPLGLILSGLMFLVG
ncbi:MAG: MFS transporter, partial [Bdellovibrionales bacterium]|nr:MFS transporter [Bdellovibrionales bacterium]